MEMKILHFAGLALATTLLCAGGGIQAQDAPRAPYFQQQVDHEIEVSLDDQAHEIQGQIRTTYRHNGPEPLKFLWIHVWPNAYANGNTALARQLYRDGNFFMFYAMQRDLGGIDSLDFKVNGVDAQWSFHPEHIDIVRLELAQPLRPGESVVYETPFRVKLPSGSISRLGHIGESYQITQWYPKPAVYDRDGWHEMPYLNQGEFYSEFGSFDVKITLPENYTVGSTGDWVEGWADNAREQRRLDSLSDWTTAQLEASLDKPASNAFPPSAERTKTLRYRASNVHDFAWFADKRWWVLKGEVALPQSGRKVTTWAMFTPESARLWKRAPEYLADGTLYYSLWNGEYPYNQVTAVDGTISAGGGMEYPNVTVIGGVGSDMTLETVIVHEVGHNWFYGSLGSNERVNAWMDEGINSFNETRYFTTKYGDSLRLAGFLKPEQPFWWDFAEVESWAYPRRDELSYLLSARLGLDQPMQCHSDAFTSLNYGPIVYKKTAAAFGHLRAYLGDARFDAAMRAYFEAWKFKHPTPEDLRAALEASTGESLGWFFEDLVRTSGATDYRLLGAREREGAWEVKVLNWGQIPGPFSLSYMTEEGPVPAGWFPGLPSGERTVVRLTPPAELAGKVREIRLDAQAVTLEYDRKNNGVRTQGILRRVEPISVRMLTRLDREDRTQLFWFPSVGWNTEDGAMTGLILHNAPLPFRDFQWRAMPMYAWGSDRLVGTAAVELNRRQGSAGLDLRSFMDGPDRAYRRSSWYVRRIWNAVPNSGLKSELWVEGARKLSTWEPGDALHLPYVDVSQTRSLRARYTVDYRLDRTRTEYAIEYRGIQSAAAEAGRVGLDGTWDDGFLPWNDAGTAHVFSFAFRGATSYDRDGNKFRWRGYLGWVAGDAGIYPLQASGASGLVDPMADHLFFQRGSADGLWGRQVAEDQGALPFIPGEIQADRRMASIRFDWDIPMKLPLAVYAGALLAGNQDAHASTGLALNLGNGAMRIQLPLWDDIQTGPGSTYAPWNRVTWSLNLLEMNPFNLLRSTLRR
jgi:hypothetical protein